MPVASKTRPLYFSPSVVVETLVMPRLSSATTRDLASRPLPPVTTVPSTSGAPSLQRSSLVGSGSPRFFTNSLPMGLDGEGLVVVGHHDPLGSLRGYLL